MAPEAKKQAETLEQAPQKPENQNLATTEEIAEITDVKNRSEDEAKGCSIKERIGVLRRIDERQDRKHVENYINSYAKGIENVEDLRTLSLDQLFKLEAKYEGILFYAFTDFMDGGAKLDFARWDEAYKNPKEGDKFKINFLGNQEAYNELGAGDILPPSIRQITVWENGDESMQLVSDERIGLKGRMGDKASGFFNKKKYMPVYTGDVIVIGAPNKDFDRYRTVDGKLDYKAYEESDYGKKEARDLIENPPEQKRKQPTPEEIDAMINGVDAQGNGKKVIAAISWAMKEGLRGRTCCWDWAHDVYKYAGVRDQVIYKDFNYSGRNCGDHHASPELMAKIKPGDWLYINNKNKYENGNHSGIFIEWIGDPANQIARIASSPGKGKKGHIKRYNLKKDPVTYIAKPI